MVWQVTFHPCEHANMQCHETTLLACIRDLLRLHFHIIALIGEAYLFERILVLHKRLFPGMFIYEEQIRQSTFTTPANN